VKLRLNEKNFTIASSISSTRWTS